MKIVLALAVVAAVGFLFQYARYKLSGEGKTKSLNQWDKERQGQRAAREPRTAFAQFLYDLASGEHHDSYTAPVQAVTPGASRSGGPAAAIAVT